MVYLKEFKFPSKSDESYFCDGERDIKGNIKKNQMTCFNTLYPFRILSKIGFEEIYCDTPITILYGGNGSGKTTVLNVIAEKLKLQRTALFNKTPFFIDYLKYCKVKKNTIPEDSKVITSDDVFNYMFNVRATNQEIDFERDRLFEEYNNEWGRREFIFSNNMEKYDKIIIIPRKWTKSHYVNQNLMKNVKTGSNGESALSYFHEKIEDDKLYLLDEPENSLSPENQIKLAEYIENAAWACGCQFIIATHSPFLLGMKRSKIYDLNSNPVDVKSFNELPIIQTYKKFFEEH